MKAPDMAAIAASLERSLQNCSLNHHQSRGVLGAGERSSSSDDADLGSAAPPLMEGENQLPTSDTTLELNSHLSLPYHWEQYLDLKTGEIYYINWRNGMKAKEDPRVRRRTSEEYNGNINGELLYSEDDNSCDSEESSSESSPPSCSREDYRVQKREDHVLVVAGCKSCFMYFMVPKQVEDCPKCNGQLLHFDRSGNGSP